jgi:biopolymer transport protein ExbB/TolQ
MVSMVPNEVWKLIAHADLMSAGVLLVLLFFSIACWATLLYKTLQLRGNKKELIRLNHQLQRVADITRFTPASHKSSGRVTYVIQMLAGRTTIYLQRSAAAHLSLREWDDVQVMADQLVEQVVNEAEAGLSFLSTSASVSPLLGLFGTVWGLVQAFLAIGQMKTTDISAVAPGIAQALVTTLAGLLVAIPAVLMYNYILSKVRSFEQELVSFFDRWSFLAQNSLVR